MVELVCERPAIRTSELSVAQLVLAKVTSAASRFESLTRYEFSYFLQFIIDFNRSYFFLW